MGVDFREHPKNSGDFDPSLELLTELVRHERDKGDIGNHCRRLEGNRGHSGDSPTSGIELPVDGDEKRLWSSRVSEGVVDLYSFGCIKTDSGVVRLSSLSKEGMTPKVLTSVGRVSLDAKSSGRMTIFYLELVRSIQGGILNQDVVVRLGIKDCRLDVF